MKIVNNTPVRPDGLRLGVVAFLPMLLFSLFAITGVRAQEDCSYEDHDTPCALANGSVVAGYIRTQGARNYFWFGAPAPETHARIELTDLPADYDLYLFTGVDPNPLAQSVTEGTAPEVIDITLHDPGVYYVYVVSDPTVPFDADNPYTLSLGVIVPEPTPAPADTPAPTPAPTATPTPLTQVPALLGRTRDASAGMVRDAGFVPVVRAADRFSEHGAETVAGQEPAAGEFLAPGSTVTVYIASGNVEVPSVAGLAEQDAEKVLHDAGFQTDTMRRKNDNVPAGLALGTDPANVTVVPGGSKVRLFISQGR